MEKTQLNKCLAAMNSGIPSKLVGVSNGIGVLATPGEISELAGCGTIPVTLLYPGKWYRIAIGTACGSSCTSILNVSKSYNGTFPAAQLFHIHADGYSGLQNVLNIYSSNKNISKMRMLYKREPTAKSFIDIYVNTNVQEFFSFAYACNIGLKFQVPVEVPNTTDEGYSVKEFMF